MLRIKRCSNPFSKKNHSIKMSSSVRLVNNILVCNSCRLKLVKDSKINENVTNKPNENDPNYGQNTNDNPCKMEIDSCDDNFNNDFLDKKICTENSISNLNEILKLLGVEPICANDRKTKKAKENKISEIKAAFDIKLYEAFDIKLENQVNDLEVLTNEVKDKINQTESTSEKIKLLTMLPKNWGTRKLQSIFPVSYHMAQKAFHLHAEQGIGTTPNPMPGKKLDDHTDKIVKEFYCNMEYSREMPGQKDFVSVKKDGIRVHLQKRLLLGNLKELHTAFKNEHPNCKISFSKFAELRPRECILAGGNGTHSVCVCKTHQNIKLMISGAKLKELSMNNENLSFLGDYKTILPTLICNPANCSCYSLECKQCPGIDSLGSSLRKLFDDNFIDNITYKKWTSTDRCTLETHVDTVDEFIHKFCDDLLILLKHDFIAKSQSKYLSEIKSSLKPGEFLVLCDFAENYSFTIQDAIQSFHWNNNQATIHPYVVYYKKDDELIHESYVIISDNLSHDAISVNLYSKKFLEELKKKHSDVQKIIYFTDGAASQYKNKTNFMNLCFHFKDFGIKAEWHFFATSHGKSPCDGVSGSVKRLATRTSLQRPLDNQITTPLSLYEWAKITMTRITFIYVTNTEYEEHSAFLHDRCLKAQTVTGSRGFHCFIPKNEKEIYCKSVSFLEESNVCKVSSSETAQPKSKKSVKAKN